MKRPQFQELLNTALVRIIRFQKHQEALHAAISCANQETYKSTGFSTDLLETLIKLELEEWRRLFMFGLVADKKDRDAIAALGYEAFLSDQHSVLQYARGVHPSQWYTTEEEALRTVLRERFNITTEEKDEEAEG